MFNMADNDWKERLGMVYSTNPDFKYETPERPEQATLPPAKQNLRVSLDRRHRGGKQVTLVAGFTGSDDDLATLGKTLKTRLGVGGAAKEGEIIIQGDFRDRVVELLHGQGYTKTRKI
jgi:translation initiation factor 1